MKIKLSGNLARFVDYQRELDIELPGELTVNAAIEQLVNAYPGLHDVIYDKQGDIKKGYLIAYNGKKLEPNQRDQPVNAQGCIDLFTAVAGG
ncbi:MoaD/ThiS family protein [Pseudomonas rubra]|uniref:MoaD/ThiS family protein n=1 Tax=Pseudomonas rubra TaxID=2942627 RepID=A0ABT5PFG1_9PSED|nr:MoaD/ThiS family protein [Pseudomonas rubra]MDD1017051.1 MoaD/ThiS family protein [Pseudomonas rubra]MDD1037110.1 MoaD/ThiS family protein [Pseudomonas rubra]MDD1153771.1 MoaD/ThiS family protein [Pseudomonas rubra]